MVAIHQILCPIDFSDISRHALEYAAAIARWYGAQLTALHVAAPPYVPPLVTSPEVARSAWPTELGLQQLRDRVAGWLAVVGQGLRTQAIVDEGPAAWCILDRASSIPADLIVLGTHGHGGFDRVMLGSVAEKVVRKAICAVMTVPPPAEPAHALPFKRLLCAVDFSPSSLRAVRYGLAMAKEADARLALLHVVEWPQQDEGREIDAELAQYRSFREERAKRELAALVREDDLVWCEPVPILEHGRAWQTILEVAEREHSDLIVIGVHGRNVVDRALFGSTTNQVVRHARCPVLTIRE